MSIKKIGSILIIISLAIGIFAGAVQAKSLSFKIGHVNSPQDVINLGAEYIANNIRALSDGRIDPKVYPAGKLSGGKGQAEIEMTQQGTIEMEITTTAYLGNVEPIMSIFSLPFLFEDRQQMVAFLESNTPVLDKISKKLEDDNLIVLGYWPRGFRQLSNSKRPVESLEDLKGLRVRVMNNELYTSTMNKLGARPVPMAFGELYNALKLKTVDGQENSFITTVSNSFHEVQDYVTVWNYSTDMQLILVNKDWWEGLSKEDQEVIQKAVNHSVPVQEYLLREKTKEYKEVLKEAGVKINYLSDDAKEDFKEKVQPIWDKYEDVFGKELMDEFVEEVSKY